jgi:hypothetical protein
MMARSTNAPFTGWIQKRKTYPLHYSHPARNTRPVHTEVPSKRHSRVKSKLVHSLGSKSVACCACSRRPGRKNLSKSSAFAATAQHDL